MGELSLTGNRGCGLNRPLGLSQDHNKCRKLDQRLTFPTSCNLPAKSYIVVQFQARSTVCNSPEYAGVTADDMNSSASNEAAWSKFSSSDVLLFTDGGTAPRKFPKVF